MNNGLDGAELTVYATDGNQISIDLSPVQLIAICKILGISYNDGALTSFTDEGVLTIMEKTLNKLKLQ